MSEMVIDFHVHLPDYQTFNPSAYEWFSQAFPSKSAYASFCKKYSKPGNFQDLMLYNGVDYSVILAEIAPLTTGIATNEMVKEFCAGNPRLIPFCTLNPYQHPNMGKELEDLCLEQGFKGIKLYPTYNYFYPNDNMMYPLYSVAERLGVPILFHTGSSIFKNSRIKYGNPIFFDDVAVDFPNLKIIMAHGGRGPWYQEALTMVRLHANVYIDVAGLPPQKLLTFYPNLERFADKFIFGTDWPNVDVKNNIEKLKNLPISREAISKIIGKNAMQILKLK